MANYNNRRLIEFFVSMKNGKAYYLYVKGGNPIRIRCCAHEGESIIYPEDPIFDWECERIIGYLYGNEMSSSLKKLYNALEEGKWKEKVKDYIDKLIDRYEKALAILKS